MKRLIVLAAVPALLWFGGSPAAADGGSVLGWGVYDTIPVSDSPQALYNGSVEQIATSNAGTFILTSSGALYAYGNEHHGALGNGVDADTVVKAPVKVAIPTGVTIIKLATSGAYDTMTAIDSTGHAWGWGDNDHGQLCNGNEIEQDQPIELPLTDVTAMAGAGSHTLIAAGGHLYACGQNNSGELGIGSQTRQQYATPQPVSFGNDTATPSYLVAAWHNSGAILSDGSYWAWGFNRFGEVGNGTTKNVTSPYEVFASGVTTATEGGGGNTDGANMAVTAKGTYAWGNDSSGQLCNGEVSGNIDTPTLISGSWDAVAGGGQDSYLMDSSHTVWACGTNNDGELGQGTTGGQSDTPVKVVTGATQISSTAKEAATFVP